MEHIQQVQLALVKLLLQRSAQLELRTIKLQTTIQPREEILARNLILSQDQSPQYALKSVHLGRHYAKTVEN